MHSLDRLIFKLLWDRGGTKFFEDGDSDINVIDDASDSVNNRRIKTDDIITVLRTLRSRNPDHSLDWTSDYISNSTAMTLTMNENKEIHGVVSNSGDIVLREYIFIPLFEFDVLNRVAPLTDIYKIKLRIQVPTYVKELADRIAFIQSITDADIHNNISLRCFGITDAQL